MASLLGTVGAFQEGQEDWTCYCERLEQFFQANGIGDEGKRRAVLLSACGGSVYQSIRNLVAPGKPSNKSFSELVKLFRTHFCPSLSVTDSATLQFQLSVAEGRGVGIAVCR